tara:strand:+ start:173 stop:526 length:354 start_codon:yes stop_codon:yes gene_type:complete
MTTTTISLAWGYNSDLTDAVAAWGARAILKDGYIDLLPDRQDSQGLKDHPELLAWLNDTALPELRKDVLDEWEWSQDGCETTLFEVLSDHGEVPMRLEACCNQSGGYLYVTAWKEEG